MKSTLFLINIAAQSAWAVPYLNEYHTRQGSIDGWAPAGPDDCMLHPQCSLIHGKKIAG